MQLLHIDSSINGEDSVTRSISAALVQRFVTRHPDINIVRRDLVAEPLPCLSTGKATPGASRHNSKHGWTIWQWRA